MDYGTTELLRSMMIGLFVVPVIVYILLLTFGLLPEKDEG